jgi:acyl carrier protein
MNDCGEAIREIIGSYGHLDIDANTIRENDDLFELGMTSHATVNVMLALEDAFDIEFPEVLLTKKTFESLAAMRAVVNELAQVA